MKADFYNTIIDDFPHFLVLCLNNKLFAHAIYLLIYLPS